ncbi:hypothetical protein B0H13DRAFT_2527670 [Mycena leptocephala]|nr:hypothetical protein B0H13DRAFT_2527670 [Mycena leptocephala]
MAELAVFLEASDAAKMCGALNRCLNLRKLQMLHQRTKYEPSQNKIDAWRLVNNRGFRLTQFTTTYHDSQAWNSQFWEDQSEIRLLSIPNFSGFPYSRSRGQAGGDPDGKEVAKACAAPPLSDEGLGWNEFSVLSCDDTPNPEHSVPGIKNISTFDVVSKAAALLPDLRHLNITEYKESVRCSMAMRFKGGRGPMHSTWEAAMISRISGSKSWGAVQPCAALRLALRFLRAASGPVY